MRGLLLLGVIVMLFVWGFRTPLLFVLTYVWASIFTPQLVAYSIVTSIPISLIFGILSFAAFFTLKKVPHIQWRAQTIITGLLAAWMTLTLLWAVVPSSAVIKWDWAIKSIAFTIIIPHFIRDRRDLEAFIWTLVIAGMAHCIAFGAKVILSGGGYGMSLGLISGNTGYGEGSTLAMFSVSLIPLVLYLFFHQTLLPHRRMVRWMLGSFIFLLMMTAIGTYARTALVSLFVLALCFIYYGKKRFLILVIIILLSALAIPFIDADWLERMHSINDDTEASAMGRVAVWLWVLEYITTHPWGGSFDMFLINSYSITLQDGSELTVLGKAFHSIYFEMLGEGGVPGFLMYAALIVLTLTAFMRHKKIETATGWIWLSDAGKYLLIATLVFLAGGAFIGVAFQSYFYYLVALSAAYLNLEKKYART